MKDLSSLSSNEVENFFNSFDFIFSDIDGVLWLPWQKFEGSQEGVAALKSIGKKVVLVSNNTAKRYKTLVNELRDAGFIEKKEELVVPSLVISSYLKKINFNKEIFLMSSQCMHSALEDEGFKISVDSATEQYVASIPAFVKSIKDCNPNVGAVIADLDLNMNLLKLQKAVFYLHNPDVLYFVGAADMRIPFTEKLDLIGPGSFFKIVEEMTNRKPTNLSKPFPLLSDFIIEKYNITDPKRVLVIGDSIPQDMALGGENGFQKLVVLTGLTKKSMLEKWEWPGHFKPDYYVDRIASMPQILKKANIL